MVGARAGPGVKVGVDARWIANDAIEATESPNNWRYGVK